MARATTNLALLEPITIANGTSAGWSLLSDYVPPSKVGWSGIISFITFTSAYKGPLPKLTNYHIFPKASGVTDPNLYGPATTINTIHHWNNAVRKVGKFDSNNWTFTLNVSVVQSNPSDSITFNKYYRIWKRGATDTQLSPSGTPANWQLITIPPTFAPIGSPVSLKGEILLVELMIGITAISISAGNTITVSVAVNNTTPAASTWLETAHYAKFIHHEEEQ